MDDEMETVTVDNEELKKFSNKYEVTWLQELKTTLIFLVGLILLCGSLFLVIFFTNNLTKERTTNNRQLRVFDTSVNSDTCGANLKHLTSKPHYAGTTEGKEVGEWLQTKLKEYLDEERFGKFVKVYNETYEVKLPFPMNGNYLRYVPTAGGDTYEASLYENPIDVPQPTDAPESQKKKTVSGASYSYWNSSFLAYSGSGSLQNGDLYYVNYGTKEDFAKLAELGVNLNGKLVIARYGKIFRGQKVKLAAEAGAVGVILYSDPAEDGKTQGPVYPDGKWRPETGLQRGSVMYLAQQPGDPTTPGTPSFVGTAARIPYEQATNVPKIPVMAISAKDAAAFMRMLTGAEVEATWKGALEGVTYRYGTNNNNAKVEMNVQMREELTLITNVFAQVTGGVEADRKVMIGNHRDPWVYGAVDPHSGTATVLEVAKGLGEMLKTGYKPRRTVVFAFWDAEEQGLIGSTEFVEQYKSSLSSQLVAYINVDNYAGTELRALGSPSLSHVVRQAASLIEDNHVEGKTLLDTWKTRTGQDNPVINYVGSGSDYTAFFHHIGASVVDLSFRLANTSSAYGTYHSIHDNYDYFSRFIDKDFKVCAKLSKLAGRVLLQLADDILLPFKISDQSEAIEKQYVALLNSNELRDALRALTSDQAAKVNATLAVLQRTIAEYEDSAQKNNKLFESLKDLSNQALNFETHVRAFNDKVMYAERGFTSTGGLPGRSWYKHVISAPGVDQGYASEIFPAVREALRDTTNNRYQLLQNALAALMRGISGSSSVVSGTFTQRNTEES